MTTVAADFKRREIAADSKCSWDEHMGFLTPKLFQVGNSIYGIAGDQFSNIFVDWAKTNFNEKKKPALHGEMWELADFDVLELAPSGLFLWDKYFTRVEIKDQEYAIGSGSTLALAAMREFKYTPFHAVELCCKYDDYTEPPIDLLVLPDLKPKKASVPG